MSPSLGNQGGCFLAHHWLHLRLGVLNVLLNECLAQILLVLALMNQWIVLFKNIIALLCLVFNNFHLNLTSCHFVPGMTLCLLLEPVIAADLLSNLSVKDFFSSINHNKYQIKSCQQCLLNTDVLSRCHLDDILSINWIGCCQHRASSI